LKKGEIYNLTIENMRKSNPSAFTLVELIVVITILAILWTIAFISLQWYSRDARDSTRTADLWNIKTSLELYSLQTWKYPSPDSFSTITYSWWTEKVWYQWVVWDQVTTNLKSLNEKPLDPLTNDTYTYSVTNSYKEYEVLALYEWSVAYNPIINQTNAATTQLTPKIAWNYNWVFVKTPHYIIPVPSIITSEALIPWAWTLLTSVNVNSQVITNGTNIPKNSLNSSQTWWLNITLSVYTWSITKSSTDTQKVNAITQIQQAYTWTNIATQENIAYILNQTSTGQIVALTDITLLKLQTNLTGNSNNTSNTPNIPTPNPDFISTWNVWIDTWVSWFNNLKLPLQSNWTYNFTVDWWDWSSNTITTWNQAEATHAYASAWTYDVTITWTIDWFAFNAWTFTQDNMDDWDKLIDIKQWWPVKISDWWNQFSHAENLVSFSATDTPDLTLITDMSYMFGFATNFNWNISWWDTSSVINMSYMFYNDASFNQNINSWDTSSVINMSFMFSSASSFNQNINSWDTSSVTDISRMFMSATSFNQPLNLWNISNVTNLAWMFYGETSFNQPLNLWDTSKVTDMQGMFENATSFNWDISWWDTSKVTNMHYMFYNDTSFNQNIGSWNVWLVTNMEGMLYNNTSFNQNIGSWNVSSVTNMYYMFFSSSFNGNISWWDTSSVTNMWNMFSYSSFNGDISSWNLSSVNSVWMMFAGSNYNNPTIANLNVSWILDLWGMFYNNTIFNQDISWWNTSSATSLSNMFNWATSCATAYTLPKPNFTNCTP